MKAIEYLSFYLPYKLEVKQESGYRAWVHQLYILVLIQLVICLFLKYPMMT